ncbi:ALQxL family class IV lanthipeptide [Streptomyces sp. NPDC051051]
MGNETQFGVDALQTLEEEEADLGLFPCTVTTCDLNTV